jgi:hypothetical protein
MVADSQKEAKRIRTKPQTSPLITLITLIYAEKPMARTYRGFARMLADLNPPRNDAKIGAHAQQIHKAQPLPLINTDL